MTEPANQSEKPDQKTTSTEKSSSIKEKVKENLPTITKAVAIAGVVAVVINGIGIEQIPVVHELSHDLRHFLGYACH